MSWHWWWQHHTFWSRRILKGLEELTTWAYMCFKTAKSRTLVLEKVKVINKFHFTLGATQIPSVTKKPVKSLGNVFDYSMKDAAAIHATNLELAWLSMVDKTDLPGKFKAWVNQHAICQILFPILIYKVPNSTINGFQRRVSIFLQKWLSLTWRLSTLCGQQQDKALLQ